MKKALMKALPHSLVVVFGIILAGIIPSQVAAFSDTGITTRTFPYMVAVILIIAGALNTWFEFKAAYAEACKNTAEDKPEKMPFNKGYLRVLAAVIAVLAWLVLLKTVGFLIMTFLLCIVLMYLAGNRSIVQMIILPLVSTGLLYYVFKILLYTPLPAGLLPW